MNIWLDGKQIRLDPAKAIGRGGEAEVFDLGGGQVAKVFKNPNHADYQGSPAEQTGARERIAEHQEKLKVFPKGLPARVIVPEKLLLSNQKTVVGYTMRYLQQAEVLSRYGERTFRQAGIGNEVVRQVLMDLARMTRELHDKQVVIGDFNDLNVLVSGTQAYLIDADSFQFGKFLARVFTAKFVDPLLCDPRATSLILSAAHNADSDWYAFAVMLMQSFLFVDPYGGVYRPADPKKAVLHGARPLKRITVFNPEVRYPKPAIHWKVLPDDLLEYFHRVFEKDARGPFPEAMLANLRWTKCSNCGAEHARASCPECAQVAPQLVKEKISVRGKVTATRLFRTDGLILFATFQNGKLNWIYHENGEFRREDGGVVVREKLDPQTRYRLSGARTFLGRRNQIQMFEPKKMPAVLAVENFGNLPVFDANAESVYWVSNGQLQREGDYGPKLVGTVLENRTLIWTGEKFGFGMYRAGEMQVAFIFDAERQGINDAVQLPRITGQLVDSTCFFAKDRAWFLVASKERGRIINRCFAISATGECQAQAEAEQGDGSWLGTLRGKCAAGPYLFAATDDGIVRLEISAGQISPTREFPDTEPFVDSDSRLFVGPDGIYVVGPKEIQLLKIKS